MATSSQATTVTRILIAALLAAFIWTAGAGNSAPWPVAIFLLAAGSTASLKGLLRRTPLDFPLLLFLVTALIGLWAAYDRDLALQKFWMLLGAYLIFYAIVAQPPQNMWAVVAILAGLSCAIAIIFLFTTDWQTYPPEFAFTRPLINRWAAVRPSLNLGGLHPNVSGGLIALLLPFQLAWLRRLRGQQQRTQRLIMIAVLALTLLALILSSSRGAILSLAASLALWTFLQRLARSSPARHRKTRLFITSLAGAGLIIAIATVTFWQSRLGEVLAGLPLSASVVERASLARQSLHLVADFPLIGGGLASFPGLYSRYILGIPYFYLPNAHNILLDLFLEQGVLGVISFILIVMTTFWSLLHVTLSQKSASDDETKLLAGASFTSFVVLLLHGMVENTVYGSVGLPLLLVAPSLAMALSQPRSDASLTWRRQALRVNRFVPAAFGTLLIASLLLPGVRALWLSNLASIHMAQVELAHFPSGQWYDASDIERLIPAQRRFEQSIRLNERQNTAHYRLGLIAMVRQDFEAAVNQLQFSYQHNSDHIGIRKALGYSYAWSGNVEHGSELLSQAPFVNQELQAYESWWRSQGRSDLGLITVQLQERIQAAGQNNPAE